MNIKQKSLALLDVLFGPSEDEKMRLGVLREMWKHPAPKPRRYAPRKTINIYPYGYKFSPEEKREGASLARARAMLENCKVWESVPMQSEYCPQSKEEVSKLEAGRKKYYQTMNDAETGNVDPWYEFNYDATNRLPGDDCRNSRQRNQPLFKSMI